MNYYSNIILLRYKQPIRQITISQRLKRILHIGVFYLAIGLSLCSCSRRNTTKKKIEEMIKSWQGKEIIFPEELIFTKYGKDTVKYNISVSDDFVATDKSIENSDIFLPVIKHQFFYIADY